jgi:hypothetical protein
LINRLQNAVFGQELNRPVSLILYGHVDMMLQHCFVNETRFYLAARIQPAERVKKTRREKLLALGPFRSE